MKKLDCVLLVDDDEVASFLGVSLIRELDIAHEIDTACDGMEALSKIHEFHNTHTKFPDLILLDIHMAGMDGLEFMEAYQKLTSSSKHKPKIIAFSSSTNPKDISRISNTDVVDYYVKPLSEDKLMGLIKEHFKENLITNS